MKITKLYLPNIDTYCLWIFIPNCQMFPDLTCSIDGWLVVKVSDAPSRFTRPSRWTCSPVGFPGSYVRALKGQSGRSQKIPTNHLLPRKFLCNTSLGSLHFFQGYCWELTFKNHQISTKKKAPRKTILPARCLAFTSMIRNSELMGSTAYWMLHLADLGILKRRRRSFVTAHQDVVLLRLFLYVSVCVRLSLMFLFLLFVTVAVVVVVVHLVVAVVVVVVVSCNHHTAMWLHMVFCCVRKEHQQQNQPPLPPPPRPPPPQQQLLLLLLHYLSGEGCQASCSQELASEVPSKAHNTYSKQYILAILTIMIVDAATPRFGAMIADQLLQEVAKHAAKGTRPRFPSAEWSWERIVSNLEVLTARDLNSSFTSRTCI